MAIGIWAVQFLNYIPLYRNTQHCAAFNCGEKTSQVSGGMNISPVEADGMNIFALEAGGMNISPDFDAEAQLTACRSTHKHAMRLFPPVGTQM